MFNHINMILNVPSWTFRISPFKAVVNSRRCRKNFWIWWDFPVIFVGLAHEKPYENPVKTLGKSMNIPKKNAYEN